MRSPSFCWRRDRDPVMSVRFADPSCDFLSLIDSLCLPRYRLAANSISKRVIGRVCLALHLRIACLSIRRLISGLGVRSFCRLLTARDYPDIAIGCTLSTWRKQFLIEDTLATSLCARSTDCIPIMYLPGTVIASRNIARSSFSYRHRLLITY